jgi:glutamate synthase (NADPH/NADH) small chain
VIVIGGGNTAIDAAVQAKRLGAASVTLVYRRGEEDMSATGWERDLARTNDVVLRLWSVPVKFEGEGAVEFATFARTQMKDGKLETAGGTFSLAADMVLKAIGQKLDPSALGNLKLEKNKIWVDAEYRTSMAGVFAGGDCIVSGADLTVQAVEDGKRAAHAADAYLRNL